jgi:hypothetical protein
MLVFNKYFYKHKKSKLYFGDRVSLFKTTCFMGTRWEYIDTTPCGRVPVELTSGPCIYMYSCHYRLWPGPYVLGIVHPHRATTNLLPLADGSMELRTCVYSVLRRTPFGCMAIRKAWQGSSRALSSATCLARSATMIRHAEHLPIDRERRRRATASSVRESDPTGRTIISSAPCCCKDTRTHTTRPRARHHFQPGPGCAHTHARRGTDPSMVDCYWARTVPTLLQI